MSNQHTVHIGFDGEIVEILTDTSDAAQAIYNRFEHLVSDEPTSAVGQLGIRSRNGEDFVVAGAQDTRSVPTFADGLTQLEHEIIRFWVQRRPDLLWIHAGAVAQAGRALLIPGRWGMGKSTIATGLCGGEWSYLSDDIVPVDPKTKCAYPFPLTPSIRTSPSEELPRMQAAKLKKHLQRVPTADVSEKPVPIGGVLFPVFGQTFACELEDVRPAFAVLRLLEACVNVSQPRAGIARNLADLFERIPAYRLRHNGNRPPGDWIHRIEIFNTSISAQEVPA